MATTIYTDYAQYHYSSWMDAPGNLYVAGGYQSRIRFNLNLNGGKKVKFTSGQLVMYRHLETSSDKTTPTVNARYGANSSSAPQSSLKVSAGNGTKTWTLNSTFLNSLSAMNGKGNFYIYLQSSSSPFTRFIGYNNSAYDTGIAPRLILEWEPAQSTGSFGGQANSANYMDELIFTISLASNAYTHKVEWFLNNEATPYFTESLPAAQKISKCSFFGDNHSNAILNEKDYFTNVGDSIPFSVKLTTYDELGSSLGTMTYSSSLLYSNVINTCSIEKESLTYGEPFEIKLKTRITSLTKINHYIGNKLCLSATLTPEKDTILTFSYPMEEVYNYFSYYQKEYPFKLETITYTGEGAIAGSQIIELTINHSPIKKLIEINQEITVLTSSIITDNFFNKNKETFNTSLNNLKSQILNYLHPIGSIYMSYNSTNPAELFGGTWQVYSPARTLYSTTSESEIGNTGGSFTHTLTVNQMPSHSHKLPKIADMAGSGNAATEREQGLKTNSAAIGNTLSSVGGGGAHINTQPYSACYMWKRIS